MKILDVYMHGGKVGTLERLENAKLRFTYLKDRRESGDARISIALPIRDEPYDDTEARPFFSGLLPEGDFLRAVARGHHVSATNAFALLKEIGGECAGAVSLVPENELPPSPREPLWLTMSELETLIEELPKRPLSVALDGHSEELRMSLAGAQEKLPVMFGGGSIGITRGRPPSTHIIKLPNRSFGGLVMNEYYCLSLASASGLDAAEARPWHTGASFGRRTGREAEFLLVTRYDRGPQPDGRLHQEDFCQALGIVPELKYQAEGGPGVRECASLIRNVSSAPAVDILAFADALIFNLIIGNHDAHPKNFSLLLEGQESPRMAPIYDLVSTVAYPSLPRKLAMKYGGEYRPEYLETRHFLRMADDLGLSRPSFFRRARRLCDRISRSSRPTADQLRQDHAEFADTEVVERIIEQVDRSVVRTLDALSD